MFRKTLYKKNFPLDPVLERIMKQKEADETNAFHAKFSSLTEMLDYLEQNTVYTPLPYKIRNRERFIRAAIELSEQYEIDVEILQFKGYIRADYSLKSGTFFRKLNTLMAMGDEFNFYARNDGISIDFSITYFTHRQERNGRVIAP